jgi:hypothetical protein
VVQWEKGLIGRQHENKCDVGEGYSGVRQGGGGQKDVYVQRMGGGGGTGHFYLSFGNLGFHKSFGNLTISSQNISF